MNKLIVIPIIVVIIIISGLYLLQSSSSANDVQANKVSKTSPITEETGGIAGLSDLQGPGIYRILPTAAKAGDEINVFLNVSVGNLNYYIIDENIPNGWKILDAGGGSTQESGHIKWVILSDAKDTVIKYRLSVPAKGTYAFLGKFTLGGQEEKFIIGNSEIVVE